MARTVLYQFLPKEGEGDFDFNVDERLRKAKEDGVITNFDDGRSRCPWFEGKPGKALRSLRNEFDNAKRKKLP